MNNIFIDHLKESQTYNEILGNIEGSQYIHGMSEESLPHFIYSIYKHTGKSVLFLTSEELTARSIYEASLGLPETDLMEFPRTDISFHNIEPVEDGALRKRQEVITRLLKKDHFITIASAEALIKKISTPSYVASLSLKISQEDQVEIKDLEFKLTNLAYERVQRVEAKGQFAIRGGIIDIFPISYKNPVRIELFDTEIDSMRTFEVMTQRSIEELELLEVGPAKEMLLHDQDSQAIIEGLEKDLESIDSKSYNPEAKEKLRGKYLKILDKLRANMTVDNLDLVLPYVKDDSYSNILDYFDGIIIYDDLDRVFEKLNLIEDKYMDDLAYQIEAAEAFPSQGRAIYKEAEIRAKAKKKPALNISQLKKKLRVHKPDFNYKLITREVTTYAKRFEALVMDLERQAREGYRIIICTGNENLAGRLRQNLEKEGLKTKYEIGLDSQANHGEILVSSFSMAKGVDYLFTKTIFLTHNEIYGSQRKTRKKKKKPGENLRVSDLNLDDYVVHENHGIAIYKGLEEIDVAGVKKDYLVLEYKGSDKLFIPTDQMDLIQRYIGANDKAPQLNKLGSPAWSKTKARAKKVIEEIAEDLVRLYAVRAKEKGFAFSKDTQWQKDFEDSFEYEETSAQLRSIKEIKEDMESERPMDRILLGDVGFGKTEVAIRAAFKAVMDGKQVALLVPTTILAQQHYTNIAQRVKDFPINVGMVSRFRTAGQNKDTLERLRDGHIDLLIGTHRILSKDVKFKDLGLLIIDEEQRFGVKDKEKMKTIKENIDVLTLSATPIPRTLQMGLVGIRNMSFLDEGPEERLPSSVYVMEYDQAIIKDAIHREIGRSGQVYFVYNRVSDMDQITAHLRDLVPEARIIMAHGQMNDRELEKIMYDFSMGDYDILVSTSIIETGMDIHNVNTMIIYNADYMGLSQLYQLKGRIGRSNRSSYAYFTYKPGKSLTEISEKRLKAIRDFGEYGSGMKIAMRDLELRGAGNILGEAQSGHIDSIGYDLYMKFLEEALNKTKSGQDQVRNDVLVDVNLDLYIPSNYIQSTSDKVDMYQRIAEVSTRTQYYDIIDELTDRFGDIPEPVINTIEISLVKNASSRLNIRGISGVWHELKLSYESRDEYNLEDLEVLSKRFGSMVKFDLSRSPKFILKAQDGIEVYEFLETIASLQGLKLEEDLQEP